MKTLIFGAEGQVGRAMVAAAPAGAQVVALTRADCDIRDGAALHRVIADARPNVVVNAAGYTAVDKAESQPAEVRLLNAVAPGMIAAAARAVHARTVHLSTDFVFDGSASLPYAPDHPTNPSGVYASTKRDGEDAVAAADPDSVIVRTAWVYAAQGANFVNTMIRLMSERCRVDVVADQVGTPTYAASLADALWRLIAAGARGIHHFTDAGVASWYDFAVAIEEEGRAAGVLRRPAQVRPIATADYPTAARRPAYSVLDKSATWALLGAPAPHWRVNLRANFEELRRNG